MNLQRFAENSLHYAIQTWADEILSDCKMAADNFLELRFVMKFTEEILCDVVRTWCLYKMLLSNISEKSLSFAGVEIFPKYLSSKLEFNSEISENLLKVGLRFRELFKFDSKTRKNRWNSDWQFGKNRLNSLWKLGNIKEIRFETSEKSFYT